MYRRIMVAVDGSPTSMAALTEAIRIATESGATLRLVHVVDEMLITWDEGAWVGDLNLFDALRQSGEKVVTDALAQVRAAGLEAETALVETVGRRVAAVLAGEASNWHAELLVVGTHGRRAFERWMLGSVAEGVVRAATMPVLLVRAP